MWLFECEFPPDYTDNKPFSPLAALRECISMLYFVSVFGGFG